MGKSSKKAKLKLLEAAATGTPSPQGPKRETFKKKKNRERRSEELNESATDGSLTPRSLTSLTPQSPQIQAATPASSSSQAHRPSLGSQGFSTPGEQTSVTPPRASSSKKSSKNLLKSPKIATGQSVFEEKGKAHPAFKSTDTDYCFTWPVLPKGDRETVIQRIAKLLEPLRKSAESTRSSSRVRRMIAYKRGAAQSEVKSQSAEPVVPLSPRSSSLKRWLCVGLNAVSRAIEKEELSLVLVCKDPQPKFLVQHLPVCAVLTSTILCAVGETSESLGRLLGAPSAVVIGFRKHPRPAATSAPESQPSEEETEHEITSVIQLITAKTPQLQIPWLTAKSKDQ